MTIKDVLIVIAGAVIIVWIIEQLYRIIYYRKLRRKHYFHLHKITEEAWDKIKKKEKHEETVDRLFPGASPQRRAQELLHLKLRYQRNKK